MISELAPGDIAQACQLFQTVFGSNITPDHWRWKYAQGPRLGGLNLVARNATGELVGHVGASIFPGSAGADSLSMVQVCDVMVARSARGGLSVSTVYPRLIQAMQDILTQRYNAPYAYGFAGVRQFHLGARLGFYRQLQPLWANYHTPAQVSSRFSALWAARKIDWDVARLDKIWHRRAAQLTHPSVSRTAAYLGWRYRDHPTNTYQLWVLSFLAVDRGWFVTRTMPNGHICIVDALLPASVAPAKFIATLLAALVKHNVELPPVYSWLGQSGTPAEGDPVIASEVKIKHWHTQYSSPAFQPGDTDVF